MADHFTATVRVTKTVNAPAPNNARGYPVDGATATRTVHSVADVTVRASTIDSLRAKLAAHVELIDDDALGTGKEAP